MASWSTLPATEKQVAAIKSYNEAYGVEINASTKQQAHDVISLFCKNRRLDFDEDKLIVEGTNVTFKRIKNITVVHVDHTSAARLCEFLNARMDDCPEGMSEQDLRDEEDIYSPRPMWWQ